MKSIKEWEVDKLEDLLIETLETFGYPVIKQGSLGPEEDYPENFFTYWDNTSYDGSHYDNSDVSCVYDYDVNFYSIDPDNTYSKLREAKKLLKQKQFIISGDGYDVGSDEPTHTGRGINALYLRY